MASLLSGILGGAKLLSNFMGAGAGSSQSGSTSGSSSTKSVGSEQSVANTKETTNTTQKETGVSTGTRQEFSDAFLKNLESVALGALSGSNLNRAAMAGEVGRISETPISFDPNAFVRDTVRGAESAISGKLESDVNQTMSAVGGSTSGNSQAALLANRLRTDAANSVAGVRASATATGQQLASELSRSRTEQLSGVTTAMDAGLATLLNALKGGETAQSVQDTNVTTGTQTTSGQATSQQNAVAQQDTTNSTKSKASEGFNWAKAIGGIFSGIE